MSLAGKVICVTGASSGIGAAIAKSLYDAGAFVAMGARRKAKLDEVAEDIQKTSTGGGKLTTFSCDVTSRESVQAFVAHGCATYNVECLDSLVCCAGVMYFTEMKNALMDQWDQTIDVNCKGITNGLGAVIPDMVKHKAGRIVAISSDAGVRDFPNLAVYCASKRFVETLFEITRRELVGTGVTLHTVLPGDVKGTELIMKNSDQSAADKMGVTIGAPVGEGFSRNQVLDPADIGQAVLTILTAPPHVAINSILVEPRDQE